MAGTIVKAIALFALINFQILTVTSYRQLDPDSSDAQKEAECEPDKMKAAIFTSYPFDSDADKNTDDLLDYALDAGNNECDINRDETSIFNLNGKLVFKVVGPVGPNGSCKNCDYMISLGEENEHITGGAIRCGCKGVKADLPPEITRLGTSES